MSKLREPIRSRRFAPWLLFFAWLAISAAQLWAREIDAVRRGVLGCFSPAREETSALSRFLADLQAGRGSKDRRQAPQPPPAAGAKESAVSNTRNGNV